MMPNNSVQQWRSAMNNGRLHSLNNMADFEQQRLQMTKQQLSFRGISDPLVLAAMGKVQRERFIPAAFADRAYRDGALPIGYHQTITQPYLVARMIAALELKGGEKVLEIGTGSGYAAAVAAEIAGHVITIERVKKLARRAQQLLADLGYANITVITGDGTRGWIELAPYDAIVVTAGGPNVPKSLLAQLKIGGRLVIPVGPIDPFQSLVCITKSSEEEFDREKLCDVCFVPLLGEEGW